MWYSVSARGCPTKRNTDTTLQKRSEWKTSQCGRISERNYGRRFLSFLYLTWFQNTPCLGLVYEYIVYSGASGNSFFVNRCFYSSAGGIVYLQEYSVSIVAEKRRRRSPQLVPNCLPENASLLGPEIAPSTQHRSSSTT